MARLKNIEKDLAGNFYENFNAFKELERMQSQDINVYFISRDENILIPQKKLDELAPNEVQRLLRNVGLSKDRWDQYRLLLDIAGIERMGYDYTKSERLLRFGNAGNALGYIFWEGKPPKTFASIYECVKAKYSDHCYVKLKEHWYLADS